MECSCGGNHGKYLYSKLILNYIGLDLSKIVERNIDVYFKTFLSFHKNFSLFSISLTFVNRPQFCKIELFFPFIKTKFLRDFCRVYTVANKALNDYTFFFKTDLYRSMNG